MMYGGSDAAPHLGPPSGWPQGPSDGMRVPGLERRRRRRLERRLLSGRLAERPPLRADRLRGVLRLPGKPSHVQLTEGKHAGDRLADGRGLRGARAAAPRDLVLVQGVEPSMRWRAFSAHLVELAEALGVQVVVTLGALLADVPHTRPVTMTGFASDPSLVERLGLAPSSYEGPTGIVGVLHTACRTRACPRRACGRASPTTSPPPPTPRRRLRWCAGWKA